MNKIVLFIINFSLVVKSQKYDIKMMTWNVEGKFIDTKKLTMQQFALDIGNYLQADGMEADIYILNFQEVIESKFASLLTSSNNMQNKLNIGVCLKIFQEPSMQITIDNNIANFIFYLKKFLGQYTCNKPQRANTLLTIVCYRTTLQMITEPKLIMKYLQLSSLVQKKIGDADELNVLKSKGGIATIIPLHDLNIFVVNVHLDAFDLGVRVQQMREVIQQLFIKMMNLNVLNNNEIPYLIYFGGDFNTRTGGSNNVEGMSEAFNEIIKNKNWTDTMYDLNEPQEQKYQGKQLFQQYISFDQLGLNLRELQVKNISSKNEIPEQYMNKIFELVLSRDTWLNLFQINRDDNYLDVILKLQFQDNIESNLRYFSQMNEGVIDFIPSYTYESKLTDQQKLSSQVVLSKKSRPLSYADRIFWTTNSQIIKNQEIDVQQLYYTANHSTNVLSDHLFVLGSFQVNISQKEERIIQLQ